jgi:hypothetical protein
MGIRRIGLGLGLTKGRKKAAGGSSFSFGDNFNREDGSPGSDWTLGGAAYDAGDISIVSNRLRFISLGVTYGWAFYNAVRIPDSWRTIEVSFKTQLSGSANNEPAVALCMDDPPTGSVQNDAPSHVMQNGYGVVLRPGTWSEQIMRYHGGARSVLVDSNLTALDTSERVMRVTFEKTGSSVIIAAYWNGGEVMVYEDADANRKVGACYVGLQAYANGGQTTHFDDFDVYCETV